MMINVLEIIAIRPNYYKILISNNDKEETIVISENVLIKNNLLSPREITDKEYKLITKVKDEEVIFEKALRFIDYKMRSISEVKKHILKSTQDEAVINRVITRLKQSQYLNDDLYVKTYLNEKIDFDLVGPRYIKDKLIQKGIHYDLIEQNLITFSDELQYGKIVELIKKETRYPIKSPVRKAYVSLKQKLVNKGFSLNVIESALLSNIDLIESAIDEENLLQNEIDGLTKRNPIVNRDDKNKMTKKLLSKGYDYELIKKLMKG